MYVAVNLGFLNATICRGKTSCSTQRSNRPTTGEQWALSFVCACAILGCVSASHRTNLSSYAGGRAPTPHYKIKKVIGWMLVAMSQLSTVNIGIVIGRCDIGIVHFLATFPPQVHWMPRTYSSRSMTKEWLAGVCGSATLCHGLLSVFTQCMPVSATGLLAYREG